MGINWYAIRSDLESAARRARDRKEKAAKQARLDAQNDAFQQELRDARANAENRRFAAKQAGLERTNKLDIQRLENSGAFNVANLQHGSGGSIDRTSLISKSIEGMKERGALARANLQFGPGSALQRGVDLEMKKKTYQPIENELGATVGYQGFNLYGNDPAAKTPGEALDNDVSFVKGFDKRFVKHLLPLYEGYKSEGTEKAFIDSMRKHNPELLEAFVKEQRRAATASGNSGVFDFMTGGLGEWLYEQKTKDRQRTLPGVGESLKNRFGQLKRGNFLDDMTLRGIGR